MRSSKRRTLSLEQRPATEPAGLYPQHPRRFCVPPASLLPEPHRLTPRRLSLRTVPRPAPRAPPCARPAPQRALLATFCCGVARSEPSTSPRRSSAPPPVRTGAAPLLAHASGLPAASEPQTHPEAPSRSAWAPSARPRPGCEVKPGQQRAPEGQRWPLAAAAVSASRSRHILREPPGGLRPPQAHAQSPRTHVPEISRPPELAWRLCSCNSPRMNALLLRPCAVLATRRRTQTAVSCCPETAGDRWPGSKQHPGPSWGVAATPPLMTCEPQA